MSNATIISRLEIKLSDFLLQKLDVNEFSDYLISSIKALEAVDDSVIETAKNFQYKFEIADFNDEDNEIESLDKVVADFRQWIRTLSD